MKKMAISSVVISLFAVPAIAADPAAATSLTTKGYVDAGLRKVNSNAKSALDKIGKVSENGQGGSGILHDIELLDEAIGYASEEGQVGTGIIRDIEILYGAVGDANSGLTKDVAGLVNGLATTTQEGNTTKQYVYKNGQLQPMDIVTEWSDQALEDEQEGE